MTAALFGVVAMLGGLAVLQAVVGHRAAERLERSGDLVEAYLTINRAVALQDTIEDEYEDAPGPALRARFLAAVRDSDAAVRVLLREGGPADVRHARRLAVTSRRYVAATAYYFDALDAGQKRLADYIDEGRVNAGSMVLATLATQAGPRHATASLREIDALKRSQRSLLRWTVVAIPLGLAVVAGLLFFLRSLRRRLDEAREQELARLERAALTDSLTGIRNHRAFEEDLGRELARSAREGSSVALVMVDLDGLKRVNDARGHKAGDQLIKCVAAALRENARSADGVYRIGGDEFAAVLPGAGAWNAFDFAQRLHAALSSGPASVSAGVAATEAGADRDALIAEADAALITAKRTGRHTVIHTAGMVAGPDASPPDLRQQSTLASALARAVDAKDSWTRSHCETVAELCALIATGLGLDDNRVEELRLAGLVHDVGKIGVPDAILQKPAALDAEEYATVKAHATLGHKILSGTELTREAVWVLHHHERIDGGGYPHGLRGDRIPLESRIIHVADAFEAMTSDRPYRQGMPEDAAIEELRRHAGTQFDPMCVDALVAVLAAPAPELAA